ncbi:related to Vacuolar protein sorting-associated protein 41 [Zygosaccharomyces bailii ISA1307]|nr:related to Vacuolar protein sorting-associated protein 41 [Zygosaccharomyces bailii ISA1307]
MARKTPLEAVYDGSGQIHPRKLLENGSIDGKEKSPQDQHHDSVRGKETSVMTEKDSCQVSSSDDHVEESESEDEDNEPPLLKFTRITKLPKTFRRDAISACLFHDKIFAFGTHAGVLHLTTTDFTPIQTLKCHRSSILCINTNGTFFATASIDGTVAIGQIEDAKNITLFDFKRPVQTVVLDADYKNSKTFVSGGMAGEVILSQRNWLGSRIDITLAKGNGPILGIHTIDDVIFWMNGAGITFFSIHSRTQLLNVPFPVDSKDGLRPDLYRPQVHCPETDRIIVGWANHVWMFKVSLRQTTDSSNNLGAILSTAASSLRAVPDKKVELEHYFVVKMLIAGISSFKDDQLMCLGFEDATGEGSSLSKIPEITIIDMFTGEETHCDEVVLNNYEQLSLNEYHLGKYIGDSSPEYFLVTPNDAIRIQELSFKDHYDWFLEKGNFMRAWEIGRYVVNAFERLETGLNYINQLLEAKRWSEGATNLSIIVSGTSIAEDDAFKDCAISKWTDMFMRIVKSDHIDVAAKNIPIARQLGTRVYDAILEHFLKNSQVENFLNYIQLWPLQLFSVHKFENELEELIEKDNDSVNYYRDAVIHLYLEESRFSKAMPHMLRRKDMRALTVLLSHNFLSQYKDNLLDIILLPYNGKLEDLPRMPIGEIEHKFDKSLELLVRNRQSLRVQQVISLLSNPKELRILLFLYLKRVSTIDPLSTAPFETDMIELYSEFERPALLHFLKTKTNYDVEKAIEICSRNKDSYNELIYLWSKVGETKRALSLIIDELNDPKLAIEFVKNLGDPELQEFMVRYSMDKPKFVKALLSSPDEFGRTYLEVIKGMPETMEIDDLHKILMRITKDNSLSLIVGKSIFKIIDDETTEYATELLGIRCLGKVFRIEEDD